MATETELAGRDDVRRLVIYGWTDRLDTGEATERIGVISSIREEEKH